MPGLHLFQLAIRLRDDATAKHQHGVHITLAAGQGHFLWPSEDAALINDQKLVSEHSCGVCIVHACVAYNVLGRIMSHTTRYYRSRLILHQAVMPPKPYFRCICRQTLI